MESGKKTRRWRKPASGSSRTASFAGIICLSQKLEEIKDTASREAFLDAVAHGSAVAWQHLNLLGEYDFSDEKVQSRGNHTHSGICQRFTSKMVSPD